MDWMFEMTHFPGHLLCLYICLFLFFLSVFIKLRQRPNLCAAVSWKKKGCDVKILAPVVRCLSPPQCASYTQHSPLHASRGSQRKGSVLFYFPATFFAESPPRGRMPAAPTSCQTIRRGETRSSEFPVWLVVHVEHRNTRRWEGKGAPWG